MASGAAGVNSDRVLALVEAEFKCLVVNVTTQLHDKEESTALVRDFNSEVAEHRYAARMKMAKKLLAISEMNNVLHTMVNAFRYLESMSHQLGFRNTQTFTPKIVAS